MRPRQHGMTLIELVVAIVVIGICVVAALSLLSSISMRSSMAMARLQANAIAASYLENIVAQPFGAVGGFHGADHPGARDTTGAAVPGLDRYRVQVSVFGDVLGTGANAIPAQRIEVLVTDPTGSATRVTGYRVNYAGQVLY